MQDTTILDEDSSSKKSAAVMLAERRGEQAARLKAERAALEKEREELMKKMANMSMVGEVAAYDGAAVDKLVEEVEYK